MKSASHVDYMYLPVPGSAGMLLLHSLLQTPSDLSPRMLACSALAFESRCRTGLRCQCRRSHLCFPLADELTEWHCKVLLRCPIPTKRSERFTTVNSAILRNYVLLSFQQIASLLILRRSFWACWRMFANLSQSKVYSKFGFGLVHSTFLLC